MSEIQVINTTSAVGNLHIDLTDTNTSLIPQICIEHFFCAYLNVAYGIIYEDKLNCKKQRKSKDKEK